MQPSLFKSYLTVPTTPYQGGKSRSEIQSDKPIYKLSSNENLLGSSPLAMQAIKDNLNALNEYPERTGASLQTALSEFYKGQLQAEQFITANSGVGIIELIVNAFLEEGLECIASNPGFAPYFKFPEKLGARVHDIPLLGDDYLLDIEGILNAINDKTRIVWVCSPNNPAGTYIPKHQIESLIAQLPEHVVLVYDEVYYQFATAEDYSTAVPYVAAGKHVIGINSFSKAYGLAGLRIGYAYSTPEIAQYINLMRRPFLLNTLGLEAAKAALKDAAFIQKTVTAINAGKAYLYAELDKIGIKYWKSQANFVLLKPEMDASEFEAKMLEQGVMVRPVANFGAPGCVRVTIGTPEANTAFIVGLQKVLS